MPETSSSNCSLYLCFTNNFSTRDQEKAGSTGVENEGYEQTSFIEDKKVHEDNTLNDVTEVWIFQLKKYERVYEDR